MTRKISTTPKVRRLELLEELSSVVVPFSLLYERYVQFFTPHTHVTNVHFEDGAKQILHSVWMIDTDSCTLHESHRSNIVMILTIENNGQIGHGFCMLSENAIK